MTYLFIGVTVPLVLLVLAAPSFAIQKTNVPVKEDSYFDQLFVGQQYSSVVSSDPQIRVGNSSHPCDREDFCFQQYCENTWLEFFNGPPNSYTTVVAKPVDRDANPVGFTFIRTDLPTKDADPLSCNVHPHIAANLTKCQQFNHLMVFDGPIQDLSLRGDISLAVTKSSCGPFSVRFPKATVNEKNCVWRFTGKVARKVKTVDLGCTNKNCETIRYTFSPGSSTQKSPCVDFISWFKKPRTSPKPIVVISQQKTPTTKILSTLPVTEGLQTTVQENNMDTTAGTWFSDIVGLVLVENPQNGSASRFFYTVVLLIPCWVLMALDYFIFPD